MISRKSELVERLCLELRAAGAPEPEYEVRFAPPRRWMFDLAFPALKLAVEVDGGTFSGGRHTSGVGFEKDCEKLNRATLLDYRVIRVTGPMIRSGEALRVVLEALKVFGGD